MIHLSDRRRIELALPGAMLARIVAHLVIQPEADRQLLAEIGRDCELAMLAPFADMDSGRQHALLRRLKRTRAEALDWMADRTIAVPYVAVVRWLQQVTDAGILVIAHDAPFLAAAERLLEAIEARPENAELLTEVDRSGTRAARRIHETLLGQGYYADFANPFAQRAAA